MKKKVIAIILATAMLLALSGCAFLDSIMNSLTEDFTGQDYTITQYDHFGNPTMSIHGDSVSVGLLRNSANFDSESTGFESEVLEFTVDGNQVFAVGDTCIIAQNGLDLITDYQLDSDIDVADNRVAFMYGDRLLNDIKNLIGKKMVVVVKSQLGIPIGVYQGDEVYVSVPSNLPKTTLITIDDKALYIHRANYSILDAAMLQ